MGGPGPLQAESLGKYASDRLPSRVRGECNTPTERVCDSVDNHRRPGAFASVDYTLTPSVRACGLRKLGLNEDDLLMDLLASELNAQALIFCTSENSAMRYSWTSLCRQSGKWLWANPPFDHMGAVVQKALREPVQLVVLAPYLPKQEWFRKLESLAEDSCLIYRAETNCLPPDGIPTPPPPQWDTILFRVNTLEKGRMVNEKEVQELWDLKRLEQHCKRSSAPNPVQTRLTDEQGQKIQ